MKVLNESLKRILDEYLNDKPGFYLIDQKKENVMYYIKDIKLRKTVKNIFNRGFFSSNSN